ncbi:MAG: polyphosphate polymerase domain-containing protein [Eubacteriales bacterium]
MRYELKILFPKEEKEQMLAKLSSLFISEIYHERQVNNIYFDTVGLSDYSASINGADTRKKYRIRWYGKLAQKEVNSLLELKYKKGMIGDKKFVSLPTFSMASAFDYTKIFQEIRHHFNTYTPEEQFLLGELLGRTPAVINTYQRRYFSTKDEKFRITLDESMDFYATMFQSPPVYCGSHEQLLLEIKFDQNHPKEAGDLVNSLGLRVGKNSKYVNAINCVHSGGHSVGL